MSSERNQDYPTISHRVQTIELFQSTMASAIANISDLDFKTVQEADKMALLLSLMACVQSPELTWQKDRNNSCKLFSDRHTRAAACVQTITQTQYRNK